MSDTLVGVIVGGGLSLMATVLVDTLRARRKRQSRWDRDVLEALIGLIATAQAFEGAQYLRGRANHDGGGVSETTRAQREEAGRAAYQNLLLAAAKARVLVPAARSFVDAVVDASKKLKSEAEKGFVSNDAKWIELRNRQRAAVDALGTFAGDRLGLVVGGNA